MKPLRADIFRYRIPFTEPVTVRNRLLDRRDGLVLALGTAEGCPVVYGEIAPLPGLHDETPGAAERELVDFLPALASLGGLSPAHRTALFSECTLSPSVQTGVEMALVNLEAATLGTLPAFPGSFPPAAAIPVNALLFGDPVTVRERAEALWNLGYRTFKLKVQPRSAESVSGSIRTFHEAFGERAELRLDANQSFGFDEAVSFGSSLPEGSVSYIEEPLADASLIPAFHAATGIRSALDETLWQFPGLVTEIPSCTLGALVLKPNRIGGIAASLALASRAGGNGLQAVFSSAFESGISLGFYAWLAAVATPRPAACGLDTFRYLDHDLIDPPFGAGSGFVDPEAACRNSQRVDTTLLEPVTSWTS